MVVPTGASVSIQTGPVTQMDGTNYVTTDDLVIMASEVGVIPDLDPLTVIEKGRLGFGFGNGCRSCCGGLGHISAGQLNC